MAAHQQWYAATTKVCVPVQHRRATVPITTPIEPPLGPGATMTIEIVTPTERVYHEYPAGSVVTIAIKKGPA